jgi:hypothetical protein
MIPTITHSLTFTMIVCMIPTITHSLTLNKIASMIPTMTYSLTLTMIAIMIPTTYKTWINKTNLMKTSMIDIHVHVRIDKKP